jgi:hypothetical protein
MSKYNHIWKHYQQAEIISPEEYVEKYLTRLEKYDQTRLEFEHDFQGYLASEREKRIDKIIDALTNSALGGFENICHRIVASDYGADPLCTYGSLLDSGRFNFGSVGGHFNQFDCHYAASNYETAFQEKFHYSLEDLKDGPLSPSEMSVMPVGSFNNIRVDISLSRCLDLRDPDSLKSFFEVISEIAPSSTIQLKWKHFCKKNKIKHERLLTINQLEQLYFSIYDPNFKQFETFLDLPSNSQWLGHYARLAGIQGIIYMSLRNENGFNIAVFPSNLKNTDSYIKLTDNVPYVDSSRRQMNSVNCEFFKCTFEELKAQSQIQNH